MVTTKAAPRAARKTTRPTKAAAAAAVDETPPEAPAAVDVSIDLDALEREGARKGPYTFRVAEQVFTLSDPREMDWQDLLIAQRSPLMFIQLCMGREQYERFLAIKVPEWKMERLIVDFFKNYGMELGPEASALPA